MRETRSNSEESPAPQSASGRRTQEGRSAETRARLIEATIDCMREHSYGGARTSDIAQIAGVTRGALQHHFPTKPDLLLAVVAQVSQQIVDHLKLAEKVEGSLRSRVEATLQHVWEVYSSAGYHVTIDILGATRSDAELSKTLIPFAEQLEEVFRDFWHRFFGNGIAPERIETTRHLARNTLRGMTVESDFSDRPPEYYADQLALLGDLVTESLRPAATDATNDE